MHRHRPWKLERQPALFPVAQPPAAYATLEWDSLPNQAQHAVTALMVRLLITYASGTVPGAGDDADER